jgi:cytochrome c peroxidase
LNPVTNGCATLGRVLFFDKQLSLNGTSSCARCHLAEAGFGDTVRFSKGFAGRLNTSAQSMRLLNLRFFQPGTAFWDRRAASLEALATQPIRDSIELGFTDAVGGIDSLIRRMRTLPFPDFTPEENRGKFLFMTIRPNGGLQCFECHARPSLNLIANARSNGVDSTETRIFRSPSLKSVATSKHFMHDGRFTSLEEVVEFYNSGVQASPLLDQTLMDRNLRPKRLGMSDADKRAQVAFLKTLTDDVTPFESRFSNPFRP